MLFTAAVADPVAGGTAEAAVLNWRLQASRGSVHGLSQSSVHGGKPVVASQSWQRTPHDSVHGIKSVGRAREQASVSVSRVDQISGAYYLYSSATPPSGYRSVSTRLSNRNVGAGCVIPTGRVTSVE